MNNNPVGSLDSVDNRKIIGLNGKIIGLVLDADDINKAAEVHVYFDGPYGTGSGIPGIIADKPSQKGNHGFEFSIPDKYKDGKEHSVYVYGINLPGTSGQNVLLDGSPKTFNLPKPVTAVPLANIPLATPLARVTRSAPATTMVWNEQVAIDTFKEVCKVPPKQEIVKPMVKRFKSADDLKKELVKTSVWCAKYGKR